MYLEIVLCSLMLTSLEGGEDGSTSGYAVAMIILHTEKMFSLKSEDQNSLICEGFHVVHITSRFVPVLTWAHWHIFC